MVANFKKKQKGEFDKSKTAFQAAGIIFLLIIVALVLADIKIYQKKKELLSKITNYKNQIESIEASNKKLKEEIANANSVDYLEKIAYEQLGQQKPGEREIIFVGATKKSVAEEKQNNFWTGWLSEFFSWIKKKN
jgi:cell division protein FtsB